jgi:hypothetical protein
MIFLALCQTNSGMQGDFQIEVSEEKIMNLLRIIKHKTMILTSAFILILLLFTGGQSKDSSVRWADNKIASDGQIDDWGEIPLNYFEDEQVTLGLSNDSTNLYILFRFNKIEWTHVIRMSGLTLWVDPKGKKKKEFGIRYRGGPTMEELRELQNSDGEGSESEMPSEMRKRMKSRMNENASTFAIIDNKAEQIVPISEDGSAGPSVGYASPDGFFCYEFKVPLEIISADFYGITMTPGQKVAIGVQWGGMGDKKRPEGMSMRGGGMGGGRGGGKGGGRGGGMSERRLSDMPKEQKIWIKTKLATGESGEDK